MGLLDRVKGASRRSGRKAAFSEPPFWDIERLQYPLWGSPLLANEERIGNDLLAYVDSIYKSSGPVFALMAVRQMVFSEARFQFRSFNGGRPGDLFGTAALARLERPWPNGTTGDLLSRMIQDADLAGNAFVTNHGGSLRRMRPDRVTIVLGSKTESDPELVHEALDAEVIAYLYRPTSTKSDRDVILLPSEVAHFAPIPDPEFHFRGMSWITPVIKEVSADLAATRHKAKFFENGATPSFVVRMNESLTPEQVQRFKEIMEERHAGVDNAYRTMYLGGGADITPLTMDLRQLDFKATQGAGETRLAAAAGVPSTIVGFSEGLSGSSLNAGNYGSAKRRFVDGTIRPLWRNVAGSLSSLIDIPAGAELWYDARDIAFLREDAKDAAEIFQTEASTVAALVREGFTPESAAAAVAAQDVGLLVHSGLLSVQLQPPGAGQAPTDQSAQTDPAGG